MENLIMEIEKTTNQRRNINLSVMNNNSKGGFGYNYALYPSINQLLLHNAHIMSSNFIRGSLPLISPPQVYSSLPHNHHHHQPPLLPLPLKSSTLPPTKKKIQNNNNNNNQKRKKKKQQPRTNYSNIIVPRSETTKMGEDAKKMAKNEELGEDTEEEFLIINGSLPKPFPPSVYSSISPPPPSSVPMPSFLLKPKINAGSCNAEALDAGATDDLRRLLRL